MLLFATVTVAVTKLALLGEEMKQQKFLCLCVCVCVYVCIYVCIYVRMYVRHFHIVDKMELTEIQDGRLRNACSH
jgi:hypothetical protein